MSEGNPISRATPKSSTLISLLRDLSAAFSKKRENLGLINPGTVDNVAREVQREVFLNNSMFTGLRADITKALSATPIFQTNHAFSMGSQGLPPYTFSSTYGTPRVCLFSRTTEK